MWQATFTEWAGLQGTLQVRHVMHYCTTQVLVAALLPLWVPNQVRALNTGARSTLGPVCLLVCLPVCLLAYSWQW